VSSSGAIRPGKIIMPMVVRPQLSPASVAIACAHGALAGYLKWKDDPIVQEWVSSIFYKRIYLPIDFQTWEAVKQWPDALVLSESKLDHLPVIAVFKPCRWSPSNRFNDFPLYG
jgi:hypothetical protein